MTDAASILEGFEAVLLLEQELGTRTVECDRALLVSASPPSQPPRTPAPVSRPSAPLPSSRPPREPPPPSPSPRPSASARPEPSPPSADLAFLLECEPTGPVAELLPKMAVAAGYAPDGVKVNDPSARVLIVLGADALKKWLPGVKALPGQWVERAGTPALVTASPTKTYRFFAGDPDKILLLKRRLWTDIKAALARLGRQPPPRR